MTLRQRLRRALTRFTRPAASIDGQKIHERTLDEVLEDRDDPAVVGEPPGPEQGPEPIRDPQELMVFDPERGMRPLTEDEADRLRGVPTTDEYTAPARPQDQHQAAAAGGVESPADRDPASTPRSQPSAVTVAETLLREFTDARTWESTPARCLGYEDRGRADLTLGDVLGARASTQVAAQLAEHLQAHPVLTGDPRFADWQHYDPARDFESTPADRGETVEPVHGPTPPTRHEHERIEAAYWTKLADHHAGTAPRADVERVDHESMAAAEALARRSDLQVADRSAPYFALSTEQMSDARTWVADSQWIHDPKRIAAMTDAEVVAGVEQLYEGGMAALTGGADESGSRFDKWRQGERADVRLAEQMQRSVPTEFGAAHLGWVEAATEAELHEAGDDRDYSWNMNGQTDDRQAAEMDAIDTELERRSQQHHENDMQQDEIEEDEIDDDEQYRS